MARNSNIINAEIKVDSKSGVVSIKRISDAVSTMEKDVKTSTSRMTDSFSVMKVAVLAVVSAAALVGKSLIDIASDMQETQGKFDVVFKGLTTQAENWAQTLQDGYAMSELEAKTYMSSLQDLLVPTGLLREEAAKMSFQMTQLAADLGSFGNFKTADVIRDIQSAIQGNSETMSKYGVTVKAADIENEALRLGFAKNKKEITAADKVQALYSITMRQSADAIGDMARTHSSYANQVKQFNANMENFKKQLGEFLLPYATAYVTKLNDWYKANKDLIDQKIPEYMGRLTAGFDLLIENADKLTYAVGALTVALLAVTVVKLHLFFNAWVYALVELAAAFKGVGIVAFTTSLYTAATAASSFSGGIKIVTSTLAALFPWTTKILAFFVNPYFLGAAAVIGGIAWAFNKLQTSSESAAGALWESNKAIQALNKNKGIYVITSEIENYTKKLKVANETVEASDVFGADSQLVQQAKKNIGIYTDKINVLNSSLREANKAVNTPASSYVPTPTPTPEPYVPYVGGGKTDKQLETEAKKAYDEMVKRVDDELTLIYDGIDSIADAHADMTDRMNKDTLSSFDLERLEIEKTYNDKIRFLTEGSELAVKWKEWEQAQFKRIDSEEVKDLATKLKDQAALEEQARQEGMTSFQKWCESGQDAAKEFSDMMVDMAQELSTTVADALWDWIDATDGAKKSWNEYASDFLKSIAKMIIQYEILQAIKSAGGSGGWASTAISAIGAALGGSAANGAVWQGGFQAFANGGKVTSPTLGLIGEGSMNEAIVPLPDGNSIPVDMKGGSGNTVVINNNVSVDSGAGGTESDRNSLAANLIKQMEQSVKQIIGQEKRFGGLLYSGVR